MISDVTQDVSVIICTYTEERWIDLVEAWEQKIVFHLSDHTHTKSCPEEFCVALWMHPFTST